MDATWFDRLPPEAEDEAIQKIASEVRKRGLEVPVVFALESHKPVGSVVANLSVAAAPFLIPFLGMQNVQNFGRLLSSRESIDRLICAIERGPASVSESEPEKDCPAEELS